MEIIKWKFVKLIDYTIWFHEFFFSSNKYTYSNSSSSSSSEVILFEHTITGPPHYTTFQIFQDFFLKMILMWKIKSTKKGPVSQNKNMLFFLYFILFYLILFYLILFFLLLYYYCFFFRLFWNFFSHFAFHSKYKCKNDVIYITVKQNITAAVV